MLETGVDLKQKQPSEVTMNDLKQQLEDARATIEDLKKQNQEPTAKTGAGPSTPTSTPTPSRKKLRLSGAISMRDHELLENALSANLPPLSPRNKTAESSPREHLKALQQKNSQLEAEKTELLDALDKERRKNSSSTDDPDGVAPVSGAGKEAKDSLKKLKERASPSKTQEEYEQKIQQLEDEITRLLSTSPKGLVPSASVTNIAGEEDENEVDMHSSEEDQDLGTPKKTNDNSNIKLETKISSLEKRNALLEGEKKALEDENKALKEQQKQKQKPLPTFTTIAKACASPLTRRLKTEITSAIVKILPVVAPGIVRTIVGPIASIICLAPIKNLPNLPNYFAPILFNYFVPINLYFVPINLFNKLDNSRLTSCLTFIFSTATILASAIMFPPFQILAEAGTAYAKLCYKERSLTAPFTSLVNEVSTALGSLGYSAPQSVQV